VSTALVTRRSFTNRAHRQETGAGRLAGDVDRTGAALRDAAAEFGAREAQDVAQYPKERHIGRNVGLSFFAIDREGDHERVPVLARPYERL
jgi:hypothetical protein